MWGQPVFFSPSVSKGERSNVSWGASFQGALSNRKRSKLKPEVLMGGVAQLGFLSAQARVRGRGWYN